FRKYRRIFVPSAMLEKIGIKAEEYDPKTSLLVVAGTGISFGETQEFMKFLLDSGYGVSSIENPIGGLFDIGINPKAERAIALMHLLEFLRDLKYNGEPSVEGVDMLIQSYATYDVVRLLSSNPHKYKGFIKSITFINPAGLNGKLRFFFHCVRFLYHHMLKGYCRQISNLFGGNPYPFVIDDPNRKDYIRRELRALNSWLFNTCKNPVKTLREVDDLVTFRIEWLLERLSKEYGFDIYIFKQTDDAVLPAELTLNNAEKILSASHIIKAPGQHNDIFSQTWQRPNLIEHIKNVRQRRRVSKAADNQDDQDFEEQ
ncbi:MAG: hypothetical protein ACFFCW_43395, partial [Candidatus Hodarchaeota archaeon]